MSGQTHHEADPQDPVHGPLPGSRPTQQRQVLAHPGELFTFQLPETKHILSWSALVSGRVWRALFAPGSPVMVEPPDSQFCTAALTMSPSGPG